MYIWAVTWKNKQCGCAPSEHSDKPVWLEPSLCAQWVAKDPSFFHAYNEDSDQTGQMPRLIWVFAGRTVNLLVLSCCGSFIFKRDLPIILGSVLKKKSPNRRVFPLPKRSNMNFQHTKRKIKPKTDEIWKQSMKLAYYNIYILSSFTENPHNKPLECNVVYTSIITLGHATSHGIAWRQNKPWFSPIWLQSGDITTSLTPFHCL